MPSEAAGMMVRTGKQLWRKARDLQERAQAIPDAQVPIDQSSLAWGCGLSEPVLRPPAAAYHLKGLSVRDAGRFLKTHDLTELFDALDPETQSAIAPPAPVEELSVRSFLEEHRNVFAD